MLSDICRIHFHIRSNAGIMAGNRDLVTNQKARIALSEVENLIISIIWLCLTRTGNYRTREFDWMKWILTFLSRPAPRSVSFFGEKAANL